MSPNPQLPKQQQAHTRKSRWSQVVFFKDSNTHIHSWNSFFVPLNIFLFFGENKKCANRSQRTEKRKLQLSPNKLKLNEEKAFSHTQFQEFAFLPNSKKIKCGEKRYTPPLGRIYLVQSIFNLFGNFIIAQSLCFVNLKLIKSWIFFFPNSSPCCCVSPVRLYVKECIVKSPPFCIQWQ